MEHSRDGVSLLHHLGGFSWEHLISCRGFRWVISGDNRRYLHSLGLGELKAHITRVVNCRNNLWPLPVIQAPATWSLMTSPWRSHDITSAVLYYLNLPISKGREQRANISMETEAEFTVRLISCLEYSSKESRGKVQMQALQLQSVSS